MNDLYVVIEYNDREFIGIDEFKNELNGKINYMLSPKWIPACSEGAEIWIDIFINSNVVDFLRDTLVSGFIYDVIKKTGKKYLFTPLFTALENLNTKNEELYNGLKVLKLKLKFDDCDVYIGGLSKGYRVIIPKIFEDFFRLKPYFERFMNGLKAVKIELPIKINDNEREGMGDRYFIDYYPDEISLDYYRKFWLITYETNFPILLYDFKERNLTDIAAMQN